MNLNAELIRIEELADLQVEYKCIYDFIQKHNNMDYVQFDYYTVNDLTLFTVEPELDLETIDTVLDKILKTIPAIKKIFSKPLLHLKEEDEVLPIESVRSINSKTIQHASSHSELWDDINQDNSIRPRKLLTKMYQDNYGIYENLVFCNLMDEVLSYTRKIIRFLKDLIYSNQSIDVNLLERVNHLNYFLALGKLHTGYIRNFDNIFYASKTCMNKLNYITNTIQSRLKSPVYKKNKIRPRKLKLRKTNILRMHKDYHKIFELSKFFEKHKIQRNLDFSIDKIPMIEQNYFNYCKIISIFSIGHFNFKLPYEQSINFDAVKLLFNFKDWYLMFSTQEVSGMPAIVLSVRKDKEYRVLMIPTLEHHFKLPPQMEVLADEYIVCTPYEQDSFEPNECYISISNIETFRRIQQIILRAMIYADKKRIDCPYCNQKLINMPSSDETKRVFECETCRTQIIDTICEQTNKPYSYTKISNFQPRELRRNQFSKEDKWLYYRKVESQMHFRNITKIQENAQFICPKCLKPHQ